jgi:hypothetical protein
LINRNEYTNIVERVAPTIKAQPKPKKIGRPVPLSSELAKEVGVICRILAMSEPSNWAPKKNA